MKELNPLVEPSEADFDDFWIVIESGDETTALNNFFEV